MKKSILFFTVALGTTLMFSCTPDEIEQNNPTQKVDIERRVMASGDQGIGIDIPEREK